MPMTIKRAENARVTKIVCPDCGERLKCVGLLENSRIEGLTFRCKRCSQLWEVQTTNTEGQDP